MRTLVIIPTYNEADNIENLIEEVEKKIKNKDCSILVVDDSSEDGTIEKVVELKRKHENIIILKRAGKLGLATAYIDGMNFGTSKGFDSFIQLYKFVPIACAFLANCSASGIGFSPSICNLPLLSQYWAIS